MDFRKIVLILSIASAVMVPMCEGIFPVRTSRAFVQNKIVRNLEKGDSIKRSSVIWCPICPNCGKEMPGGVGVIRIKKEGAPHPYFCTNCAEKFLNNGEAVIDPGYENFYERYIKEVTPEGIAYGWRAKMSEDIGNIDEGKKLRDSDLNISAGTKLTWCPICPNCGKEMPGGAGVIRIKKEGAAHPYFCTECAEKFLNSGEAVIAPGYESHYEKYQKSSSDGSIAYGWRHVT